MKNAVTKNICRIGLKSVSPVSMRTRQKIMTLNGNAGVGMVNVITKSMGGNER